MSIPRTLRAMYMRGGTSKGIFLREQDLPKDRSIWPEIFRRIMGSPCSHSRQLNGMGGGISSLSKICVLGESPEPGAVRFTFAQVSVGDESIDFHGTCGNLMSAVPLFAVEEGLVMPKEIQSGQLSVVVHDQNTSKTISTHFPGTNGIVDWTDNYQISGVDGMGVRVATEYLNCGGTKTGKLWPTGNQLDVLEVDGQVVRASLIDGPNPAVLCDAEDLRLEDSLHLTSSDLIFLENIRLAATVQMGIAKNVADAKRFMAIPKLCLLQKVADDEKGIKATTLSMGIPHKAIPVTIGLSLAIAMSSKGSIAQILSSGSRIHHPTGFLDVQASLDGTDGVTATVIRSARRLMKGEIYL